MITLDELLYLAYRQADAMLVGGIADELAPAWLVLSPSKKSPDGKVDIILTPWESTDQKLAALDAMRTYMRKRNAVAYSFVMEAWVSFQGPGPNFTPASEDPNRIEVVAIIAADRETARQRDWKIVRGKAGKVTALEPIAAQPNTVTVFNRFASLLRDELPN